jgi:hypothetical protein
LVDSLELGFLRRYIKEAIEMCDIPSSGNVEDDTDAIEYFGTADVKGAMSDCRTLFTIQQTDLINSSRKYINKMRSSFETLGEKICHCLCLNKLKKAETFASHDSLFLYAFYLDPDQARFVSPVEFISIEVDKMRSVDEIFVKMRRLARVVVSSKHKSAKEAAFLYWTLG